VAGATSYAGDSGQGVCHTSLGAPKIHELSSRASSKCHLPAKGGKLVQLRARKDIIILSLSASPSIFFAEFEKKTPNHFKTLSLNCPEVRLKVNTLSQPPRQTLHCSHGTNSNIPLPPNMVQMENAPPPLAQEVPRRYALPPLIKPTHPSLNTPRPRSPRKHVLGIPPHQGLRSRRPLASHRTVPAQDTPRRRECLTRMASMAAKYAPGTAFVR
jgi:hypothetical protein